MSVRRLFSRTRAGEAPVVRDGKTLIDQYRIIYGCKKGYGSTSERQLGFVQQCVSELSGVETILDYGCGRSRMVDWLAKLNDARAFRYDPAIPEFADMPVTTADLVINTDVLEHVPEPALPELLQRIRGISQRAYFNISTKKAAARLPNGDNAHCTVRPREWWHETLAGQFDTVREVASYRPTTCSFVTWPEPE